MRTAPFPGLPGRDVTSSESSDPVEPLALTLRDAQPADVIRSLVSSSTAPTVEDMDTNWEILEDSEVERIYKRIPPLDSDDDEGNTRSREMEFVKRDSSLAVPRSQGETVQHTFPPQADDDGKNDQSSEAALRLARDQKEMESSVLRVVRHMPEGEVPMAPHLTVTFSQPMAAVSTLDQLSDASDWIEIEPRVPGRYRWLGTQTIMFEPEHRFPMSTEYLVRVRADRVQSASSGARLQRDFEFKFSTPTARVRSLGPNGVTMTNEGPVFHVQFDQKIDAEKVLQTIHLIEAHQPLNSYPLKLLSTEDAKQIVESQGKRSNHLKHFYTSNWETKDINQGTLQQELWFTTQQKELPLDKHYTITVGPHVPSQEGPRTSDKKQAFSFSTFAPLRVSHHYPSDKSVPLGSWTITFNNAIDQDRFEQLGFEQLVKISPALDKAKYNLSGSSLSISGRSKGDTTYTVELSPEIEDVFGQRLRESERISFQVGRAAQTFHAFMQGHITLDPTEPHYPSSYSVVVCNVDKLSVQINQVRPEQFGKAQAQFRYYGARNKNNDLTIGHNVFRGEIETGAAPDEPKEVVIDISKYLQHANEKLGHIMIHVEPSESSWKIKNIHRPRARAWIQSTRIAVDTFMDQDRAICFTNSLADGRPYDGVSISAIPMDENKKMTIISASAVTDSTGMTQVPDLQQSTRYLIVATHRNDSCIVQNCYPRQTHLPPMTWYVVNDRGLYKPKEKVYMKGIIRFLKSTEAGAFYRHEMPTAGSKINFRMSDARGVEFAKGSTETNQYGAFVVEQQLPDNINLGNCSVIFEMEGRTDSSHYTNFQVQEFRTPEFKVQCELLDTEKPHHIADDSAVISVKASYYAGGPLPGTNTEYLVTQESSRYTPPGWSIGRWIFQKEQFGWFMRRGTNIYPPYGQRPVSLTHSGTTDATGEHQLCIDFKTNKQHHPRGPATIVINASVQDINRQTLSTSTSLLVHPCSLYVGIKPRKRFGKAGTPFVFDVIVTDIRGKVVPNVPFTTSLIHHSNEQKGNQVVEKDVTIMEQSLESENVEKEVQFDLPPEEGGSYTVSLSIKDTHDRINETSMTFSVQGITSPFGSNTSSIQDQQLTIIADKDEYEPGDEAQLLVQVPFSEPCELVVLTATGRIVDQSRQTLETENCTLIRIPIKQEYLPRVNIKVYAVSAEKRIDESGRVVTGEQVPLKPAFGSGNIELKVSLKERRLNVDIKPAKQQLSPGNSTDVDIAITDHIGVGIPNAEVTLIAVDEAILSLTNYSLADPLPSFYPAQFSYIDTLSIRSTMMVRNWSAVSITAPQEESVETLMLAGGGERGMRFGRSMMAMPMMKMAVSMDQSSGMNAVAFRNSALSADDAAPPITSTEPIQARTNFDPVAAFVGSIVTDSNGVARTKIQLPDNLTRYRVWAIGHTLDRFGLGESHLIASLPLMVRCSLPRFANFGDRIEATVLIQNQTSDEATVNVVSRYLNLKHADGSTRGFKLRIPASDRKEVRFSIATVLPGEAKFQCGAELVGTNFADAAVVNIPVYTPTTTEAFATYGEIDGDGECIVQPIARPQKVYSNFGGLKINTSSTILQSLTDAFIYLWEYPFLCVEQISSRILSIVALQDVLEAFNVEGLPSREKIVDGVNQGLQQLKLAQKDNGSFGFWDRNSEVHPYVTVHAAFALIQAKMQGHKVDDQMINSVASWLRNIEQHLKSGNLGSIYNDTFALAIRAYALYVLSLIDRHAHGNMGDRAIVTQAKQLFAEFMIDERTKSKSLVPDLECLSWLAQAIFNCNAQNAGDEVVQHALHVFRSNCQETAETANYVTNYSDDDSQRVLLRSSRRTDGIVLDTLLCIDSQKQQRNLVTKVVKGLLAQRKRAGRWRNTQENVFILLALKNFFQKYESAVPDYVARMWIAEQFAGEQQFKGRSVDTQMVNVPMSFLMDSERSPTSDLVIQKAGKPGRLYYRIGMDYAPLDLRQAAAQYGFTVVRTYEHVSDPSHVSLDADQQCWKFKLGELVRVRIKISNVSRRYHVAMADWMPAGLEALNPELATTGPIPDDDNDPPSLFRNWWSRSWYEHTNMRDERVEAFASLLWEGDHEFTYVARATSAGEFVVPPCKIEEMYSPEIFGRSASEMVVIR